MMDLFVVVVIVHQDRRYVDSYWVKEESAKERSEILNEQIKATIGPSFINASGWRAFVSKARIEDASFSIGIEGPTK